MTVSVVIPFDGFYNSLWSNILDREEESHVEHEEEKQRCVYYAGEGYEPDPALRLDSDAFRDALFDTLNHAAAYRDIAKDYAQAFNIVLKEAFGRDLKLTFEEMTSPRFYNFETDRIFCQMPARSAQWLLAYSKRADNHARLSSLIEERHSSRSGFISFYSADSDDWCAKPLADWDHNELSTLLLACMEHAGLNTDYSRKGDDWRMTVYEALSDGGYVYLDRWNDWRAYDAKIADAKEALRREVYGDDPDAPRIYRCPDTQDMFAPSRA